MRKKFSFIVILSLFLLPLNAVFADDSASEQWAKLSPEKKEEARANFRAYQKLSPEEKTNLDNKYEQYKVLSPTEKSRVLKNYAAYKKLSPEKQQKIKMASQKYSNSDSHKLKGPKKPRHKKS